MPQVTARSKALAIGCALLAVLAVGCSKKSGGAFDPYAGHPDDFFADHPAEYRKALASCDGCHGSDLLGGISAVSCYSASRDGQSCHPGGPSGHPAGWRAAHSADPSRAATCAPCHDNPSNNLPPNCFDNSLCHGPKAGHPAGWRRAHSKTSPSLASTCAQCHDNPSNNLPPNCFNNSLCHGAKSAHPAGWLRTHTGTNQNQASVCAQCHDNPSNNLPPDCFNNSLCHGPKSNHPAGWRTTHQSTTQGEATSCAGCHPEKGTPSCYSVSSCHGGGGHPAGWSAGGQHGAAAKASGGFASCQPCHGSNFGGGTTGTSCLTSSCHGWGAPHASRGWNNGGSSHRSTSVGNVSVCAQCHPVSAPSSGSTCSHNGGACHED